jgi:hypothetical protein
VSLRPAVLAGLSGHGITPAPGDTPETLREKLNDRYLEDVRELREKQRAGEIPLREYAGHADALKHRYPLLSLPLSQWVEDAPPGGAG